MKYSIRYHAKETISIEIQPNGTPLVQVPIGFPKEDIEKLIAQKEQWLLKKSEEQKRRNQKNQPFQRPVSPAENAALRKKAAALFQEKADYYAARMGVSFNRIRIGEAKHRFGSCSTEGNLNFNLCLLFAPEPVLDYVVIHELAHLKEMNHSSAFWAVVEKELPIYRLHEKWLKDHGRQLLRFPNPVSAPATSEDVERWKARLKQIGNKSLKSSKP